jgi:transcriptional regulator GlxA family with amidase domain
MFLYQTAMASRSSAPARPALSVGIVPLPDFTMLAFSGFVDTLRLAADEGDRSRPIRCAWTVMSERRRPVRASNGVVIQPRSDFVDPAGFDYVVVVGGLLHGETGDNGGAHDYLRRADRAGVRLVGLCTGSLALARAGLMEERAACVSWFHHDDYVAEFPHHQVVSDRLFLDAGDRITSAGGVSVVHLASWLVERHCGPGSAQKGLRIMIEEQVPGGDGAAPQPAPDLFAMPAGADDRVRRALVMMDRLLAEPLRVEAIADAVDLSPRQLGRLFREQLGRSPARALLDLRLARARQLLDGRPRPVTGIAAECGFCDAAHLGRHFRATFGISPGAYAARQKLAVSAVEM